MRGLLYKRDVAIECAEDILLYVVPFANVAHSMFSVLVSRLNYG